ncbi:Transmembrane channel-like protein 3 [Folsomia candida]|uniref:Transmembrane channel-like protein 3 n=1 Tax=Folsomia candida TaxID=158441 RepID=A0A226EI97_FOLCA|nr:Transmembrane channel-like protein 3 [Folsomia candida]
MARFKLMLMRYWQHLKRQLLNMAANMIPWELRIKQIESHFGSVISAILICFVVVPEVLAADPKNAGQRKMLLPSEEKTATYLSTIWEFEGSLKHSPFFYGFYTDQKKTKEGYPLPLSYFMTGMGVYIYSFIAILRKMAKNSRQSKLSEKEDECAFSWKLFCSWDYMIGNPETAFNRFASITMGFKEALLEEKERTKDERNWKIISLRVLANFLILLLLMSSAGAVVLVVRRSGDVKPTDSWWRQNEITLALSLITTIFPNIFELIGLLENYHPRKQLRWQLARIMVLNFLNLYTLIFALFGKVAKMSQDLEALRPNYTTTLMPPTTEPPFCSDVSVNCTILENYASYEDFKQNNAVLVFIANLTTLLPINEISSSLAPNTSHTMSSNGKFNMTEWWKLIHTLLPTTDISQIFNAGNVTEYTSETWSEYADDENYTFWTNQSTVDLNETSLWTPENKTALITALPIMVKLLSAYLATIVPTLTRTTPFLGDLSSNVTYLPILSSTYANASSSSEYYESTEIIGVSSAGPDTSTFRPPKKIKPRKPGSLKKNKTNGTRKPKFKRTTHSKSNFPNGKPTDPPDEDYTQPDWSKYPVVSEEDEDDSFVLKLGRNGNGFYGKSSTRGDIPVEPKEDPSTTTTTEMPSTTTFLPEPTTPESLDKFLTNVMAVVTMIFNHNSTKTDEIDYSKVRDFSKWVTTLESVVETRKVTSPYWNSTFGTTVKVNMDDKETKKCYVTICEDGKTSPSDLNEFLNCTDTFCSLEVMLGPRTDNCWVPQSRSCITTTEPPPTLPPDTSIKLRKLCWETMFGQELVKLTVMDLIFTVGFILVLDFIRAILVRILNPCWCWDLEKKFPQYGDFKIAENILHLVNNQGMVWMGMFFSPGLPTLNLIKLVVLMYIRSWAVMTCNVPHETVFRASRSNNFYFALLLFMLFLCTLPVAFAVVWLQPSWHCGPFSNYERIYHILTQAILNALPESLHWILNYIASPGIVIPLLVLLILIIYYLLSLTGALREANVDLKFQLRRERTEERRKMFKMAGKKDDTPMGKWQSLIPMMNPKSSGEGGKEKRTSILTSGKMTGFAGAAKRAALKTRQLQAAAAASAAASAEDDGNATDIDQASLPEDVGAGHRKTSRPSGTSTSGVPRKPSCTDSVASTRSEIPVIKISEEEESKAGPSGAVGESAKPIVVPSKKQRVLKALIKAGKEQEQTPEADEKSEDP